MGTGQINAIFDGEGVRFVGMVPPKILKSSESLHHPSLPLNACMWAYLAFSVADPSLPIHKENDEHILRLFSLFPIRLQMCLQLHILQ